MAYKKTEWVDHIKDINTGNIIQQGTAITANRLNNIENAVERAYNAIEEESGYGIEWNFLTDTYKRIGQATGLNQEDFDSVAPWSNMRRCIVNDDLDVLAYHGDLNYADGGALGQAMVEIKKFYVKAEQSGAVKRYWINDKYSEGFHVHPAFVRDGVEVDEIYVGTYQASIFDVSAAKYLMDDEQVADFAAGTGDVLASIAGAKPASGQTQALHINNARNLANNRGENWGLLDFDSVNAIQMLFLVEYATFNSQAAIGQGVVSLSPDEPDVNMSVNNGQTSSLGNKSGEAAGISGEVSISYRGIENLWGNIYVWLDGLNIRNHVPYVNSKGTNFVSDKFDEHYVPLGFSVPETSGYAKNVEMDSVYPTSFIPNEVGGSTTTYLSDYFYQSTGNRVAAFGGAWSAGATAGAFFLALNHSSSNRNRDRGARLLGVPAKIN